MGNLTYDEADAISKRERERREDTFQAALSRYIKITSKYGKTSYASMAQFKKAMTYEKMGEPDIAAAEYVKLAYRYPDSEYLAVAMARLGFHVRRVTLKQKKVFDKLVVPEKDDHIAMKDYRREKKLLEHSFVKFARILEKVIMRFPSHPLAVKCALVAGDGYRRGDDTTKAVKIYKLVYKSSLYDADDRAQAMYWVGRIFLDNREMMQAYTTLSQISIDFPETEWAANARALLSDPALLEIDTEMLLKAAR